jgi:hypothetical protein
MNKETTKVPSLVNKDNFKIPEVKKNGFFKFDINAIILIGFLLFFVFFLLNCKSGIFENIDLDPIPYSMIK